MAKKKVWALMIHGGAGSYEARRMKESRPFLENLFRELKPILLEKGAREAVIHGVRRLEDHPDYNSGTGSCIQADGVIRMTACFMDSQARKFSSVINIENVRNPIEIAAMLQREKHPNLAGFPAKLWARMQGVPDYNPLTMERFREYQQQIRGETGTVGVVALDPTGIMAAGTSTGGVGFEIPGRVSDDASPCGNYCTRHIAISATGVGEDFINLTPLPRLAGLLEFGIPPNDALAYIQKFFRENQGRGGWISILPTGHIGAHFTTEGMRYYGENSEGAILSC